MLTKLFGSQFDKNILNPLVFLFFCFTFAAR